MDPAWRDAATRKAVRRLGLRSATLALLGVALLFAMVFLLDDAGDPMYGIPVFVTVGIFSLGVLLGVLGICFLVVVVRMRIILGQNPWVTLPAHFKSFGAIRYNRPVRILMVTLGESRNGERHPGRTLELFALGLTWKSFSHDSTVLVCTSPSGRSRVVAAVDYRIIAWASPARSDRE